MISEFTRLGGISQFGYRGNLYGYLISFLVYFTDSGGRSSKIDQKNIGRKIKKPIDINFMTI